MKRAAIPALLLACLLAGALAAAVLASPRALLESTSIATTAATEPTTVSSTTASTTTTTSSTTTTTTAQTIAAGVRIGGVRVGGLTPAAAYQAVRHAFDAPLVLVVGRHRLTVAPASRPWTDDRAPVEWITDRMIVAFAAHGGSLRQRLLPTAPRP